MTAPNSAPAYQYVLETLILEAINDTHRGPDSEPVSLVELHSRLSKDFFADAVRDVIEDMLSRGRIRVVFHTPTAAGHGKHWTPSNRPAVRLEAGEVCQ